MMQKYAIVHNHRVTKVIVTNDPGTVELKSGESIHPVTVRVRRGDRLPATSRPKVEVPSFWVTWGKPVAIGGALLSLAAGGAYYAKDILEFIGQ